MFDKLEELAKAFENCALSDLFEKDPKRTPFIMSKIYRDDAKISRLIKKLTN